MSRTRPRVTTEPHSAGRAGRMNWLRALRERRASDVLEASAQA